MDRRPLAAALLVLAFVLPACTEPSRTAAPSPSATPATVSPTPSVTPSPSASPAPSATPSPTPSSCPATYAAPDPDRPVVELSFAVAADKGSATGREKVTFTPDRAVDRLVFRLWANGPRPRASGGRTSVSRLTVDGEPATFSLSARDTLLSAPLGRRVPAGTTIVAELDFRLVLPSGANERLGHTSQVAWFGSGFPLLAWERGRGWATEPPTAAFAEATTSEAFRLELSVDTAPGDVVLGTGTPTGTTGRVRRRSAESVRDVLVAVGAFRTATTSSGDVPITVGVAPGLGDDPARLGRLHVSAMRSLAARFGPFPYATLDVAVVPHVRGGIEFPGGIILGSRQDTDATLVHEVAHEWFYGLVGDNQGRDPWLDEAFATYAEGLVRGTGSRYLTTTVAPSGRNRVGAPMTYWESRTSVYYRAVYVQGAAMLLRARAAVGAAAWDRAIRCYVNANAHRVAAPADLQRALAGLPAAIAVLRRAGALPPR